MLRPLSHMRRLNTLPALCGPRAARETGRPDPLFPATPGGRLDIRTCLGDSTSEPSSGRKSRFQPLVCRKRRPFSLPRETGYGTAAPASARACG